MGVIATVGSSLSTGRRRFIDRAPGGINPVGILWAARELTGTTSFWYSTDNGQNWTQATGSLTATAVSLFVDLDGGLNIVYEAAGGAGFVFRRGTFSGSTITWGTEATEVGNLTTHDLVVFRNPGGAGWIAMVAARSGDGNNPHLVYRFNIAETGVATLGGGYTLTFRVQSGSGFDGTIDFHHTGDGKTVQGGTPHVYVVFRDAFGVVSASRLVWNGSGYTVTDAVISTPAIVGAPTMVFDGTRMVIAGNDTFGGQAYIYERDALNTATIDRGASTFLGGTLSSLSLGYDRDKNIHLLAITSADSDLYRTKWVRATGIWDAAWTPVIAGTVTGASLRVGWGGASWPTIEALYKDATNLSYQQLLVINAAPSAPTMLAPADGSAQDVAATLGISWQFNDPDIGDSQTAYTVRRRTGVLAFNYWNGTSFVAAESAATKIVSGAASLGLSAGWGVDSGADQFYSVKTWDQLDQPSPWSAERRVIPSAKDNPTITDPASNGFDITTATYTAVWTVATQTKYTIRVIGDTAGAPNPAIVDYAATVTTTTGRAHVLAFPVNSVTRQIELTTWNDEGLQSTVVYRIVDVAYTPPNTPTMQLNTSQVPGAIRVTINNPGGGVAVGSNDLFRRIVGDTSDGIRIGTNLAVDAVFNDYAVASGVAYSYRAKAIATTGAIAYSAWTT